MFESYQRDEAFSWDPSFLGRSQILPGGTEQDGFGYMSVSDDAAKVQHPMRHLRFADSERQNTLERRLSPPPTLPLTL